jgi:hypothetical protein
MGCTWVQAQRHASHRSLQKAPTMNGAPRLSGLVTTASRDLANSAVAHGAYGAIIEQDQEQTILVKAGS